MSGFRGNIRYKKKQNQAQNRIGGSENEKNHTGMINGQTAASTGQFPMRVSQTDKYVDDGILLGKIPEGLLIYQA